MAAMQARLDRAAEKKRGKRSRKVLSEESSDAESRTISRTPLSKSNKSKERSGHRQVRKPDASSDRAPPINQKPFALVSKSNKRARNSSSPSTSRKSPEQPFSDLDSEGEEAAAAPLPVLRVTPRAMIAPASRSASSPANSSNQQSLASLSPKAIPHANSDSRRLSSLVKLVSICAESSQDKLVQVHKLTEHQAISLHQIQQTISGFADFNDIPLDDATLFYYCTNGDLTLMQNCLRIARKGSAADDNHPDGIVAQAWFPLTEDGITPDPGSPELVLRKGLDLCYKRKAFLEHVQSLLADR